MRVADDSDLSPFAAVTHFTAEKSTHLKECADLASMAACLDRLRASSNVFYGIRVDGSFPFMHTRAMCKSAEGTPLAVAAAHQPEFRMRDVIGTLVGFWSPKYIKTLEIPGYHLHFLTDDRSAGGHLMECSGRNLLVQIGQVGELRVALPENEEFLKADLTRDPTQDLDRAEHARKQENSR